jgi:hypothetical protein
MVSPTNDTTDPLRRYRGIWVGPVSPAVYGCRLSLVITHQKD